jgi:hypothetical protein
VNVDGRNAASQLDKREPEDHSQTLADDMPALKIIMKKRYRPTRSLTESTTVR